MKVERAVLRLLFEYLRGYAGLQRPPSQHCASAADTLLQNYKDHLRKDRGLTENSVLVYAPFIRDFLAAQTTQTERIPGVVRYVDRFETSFLSTPPIGPASMPGCYARHSGRFFVSSFYAARPRGTSLMPFPCSANIASPCRPRFSRPAK